MLPARQSTLSALVSSAFVLGACSSATPSSESVLVVPPKEEPKQTVEPRTKPVASGDCPEGMIFVEGGSFAIPSRRNRRVEVRSFCMDRTEITAEAYSRCRDCDKSGLDCDVYATYGKMDKYNFPIVCVTPQQAVEYCAAMGKRLPTSPEWEWAGRGGDNGWDFPWGDEEPDDRICWARQGPCPVGTRPADRNPQGILDLGGNVCEFTATIKEGENYNEYRGGSWGITVADNVKASDASGTNSGDGRSDAIGFRCVATAE